MISAGFVYAVAANRVRCVEKRLAYDYNLCPAAGTIKSDETAHGIGFAVVVSRKCR